MTIDFAHENPLSGKLVVVVGLGESGVAAARSCLLRGAHVLGTDIKNEEDLSPEARALLEHDEMEAVVGGHAGIKWEEADCIVVSPGVPQLAGVVAAEQRGVPVLSEIELATRLLPAIPVVAIGGTNGKSTTTTLVGAMLEAAGKRVFVGGNLGTPLAALTADTLAPPEVDALVLEISSFQAEKLHTFRPHAATILNITPDHMDRYPTIEAYAAAKGNMVANMEEDDTVVVPHGDSLCLREARRSDARIATFGAQGDFVIEDDAIVDRLREERYLRSAIKLRGHHNAKNAAAAIALAAAMGARPDAIRTALATFAGLPHRTALVRELDGVAYYDDSKGTNVGAAVTALRGLTEERAVLIAGGRDKKGGYDELAAALREKGRAVVVIGEAALAITQAVERVVPVAVAKTMEEAVEKARAFARPGDAVLLSPACSSYDMFRDYKERGDVFAAAVNALPEGP